MVVQVVADHIDYVSLTAQRFIVKPASQNKLITEHYLLLILVNRCRFVILVEFLLVVNDFFLNFDGLV